MSTNATDNNTTTKTKKPSGKHESRGARVLLATKVLCNFSTLFVQHDLSSVSSLIGFHVFQQFNKRHYGVQYESSRFLLGF